MDWKKLQSDLKGIRIVNPETGRTYTLNGTGHLRMTVDDGPSKGGVVAANIDDLVAGSLRVKADAV
jgi:hypothetical protein